MNYGLDDLIIDKSVTYKILEEDDPLVSDGQQCNVYIDQSNKKLSQIFKDFPDNCYINKSITGCGGTTLALRNAVNYVVLVPYVNLLQSKLKDNANQNILPVFSETTNANIDEYLRSDIQPKKIICTYDSLLRLMSNKAFDVKQFKLLVDEAHTLVNLGNFKTQVCENVLMNYKKFKSCVFLTATPTKREYFPSRIASLPFIIFQWGDVKNVQFEVNRSVKSMNTDIASLCADYFLGTAFNGDNAHIFYNSVAEIALVIRKLKVLCKQSITRDDIRIICSANEKNEKVLSSRLGKSWGYIDSINTEVKRINFYTSTAFEGADVYDEKGRTYIVINGVRDSTKVDFHVLVPQICGRVRDSVYSDYIALYVGNLPESAKMSKEEWEKTVNERVEGSHQRLAFIATLKQNKDSPKQVLDDLLEKAQEDVYTFQDENGEFYVSDVAQKSELQSYEALQATYVVKPRKGAKSIEAGYSASFRELLLKASTKENYSRKSATSKVLNGNKTNFPLMLQEYCEARDSNNTKVINIIEAADDTVKMLYDTLGHTVLKNLRYRGTYVRQAFVNHNVKKQKALEITVMLGYKPGDIAYRSEIKDKIQKVYDQLGIEERAKALDIKNWFDVKLKKMNNQAAFYFVSCIMDTH